MTKGNKTWPKATKYFQNLVSSDEMYTNMDGGTAKSAFFDSTARTDERDNNEVEDSEKL